MSKSAVPYLYGAEETIPIEQLHPFANHPFHVRHDLEMKELMDSIEESGIIHSICHTRTSQLLCSKTKTKVEVIMRLRDKVKEQAMQMREGDNQRSPLKGRFTRFIRHRMKWHASEYYRKHKPRENVSPLDDVEDQLYDPEVDVGFVMRSSLRTQSGYAHNLQKRKMKSWRCA